ncbi:MAG: hypothetical protein WC919_03420 [Candidatus Paceibacterota bacterium]|jgi:hypothetical protein
MTPEQQRTIYDWALIHEYAKGKVSGEMMVEVGKMDRTLFSLVESDAMPDEFTRFMAARADPGCSHCWISSKISGTHPECQTKIKEWFDAREALITFGLKLDRSDLAKMR